MDRVWSDEEDQKGPRWQKLVKHFERVEHLRVEQGHRRFDPSQIPRKLLRRQNGRLWQGGVVSETRPLILQLLVRPRI